MPPKDDVPDWQRDAVTATSKFATKGDTKGVQDAMGAFDRHCEIEEAQKDMNPSTE